MFLPRKVLEKKLLEILAEDLGQGDVTTTLLVPEACTCEAEVRAKQDGVVAGIEEATILLESLDLRVDRRVADGNKIKVDQVLMKIRGDARTVLSAERTVLNIVSRMSGIATITRRLLEKIEKAKLKTRIGCTRKTAPGLLYFDKKAVSVGGGDTHRLHLDDMILIKDNHLAVVGNIEKAVTRAREKGSFSKKVEVEVQTAIDALKAAESGADAIMFDNFSPKQVEKAVGLMRKKGFFGKVLLEASGGITEENVLVFVKTGVDIVSLGMITHSPKALDVSLELKVTGKA
jgi:nicotinate-nucleotide pyrophosphorylase (carboxylating)